jgi:hypothetical protein
MKTSQSSALSSSGTRRIYASDVYGLHLRQLRVALHQTLRRHRRHGLQRQTRPSSSRSLYRCLPRVDRPHQAPSHCWDCTPPPVSRELYTHGPGQRLHRLPQLIPQSPPTGSLFLLLLHLLSQSTLENPRLNPHSLVLAHVLSASSSQVPSEPLIPPQRSLFIILPLPPFSRATKLHNLLHPPV